MENATNFADAKNPNRYANHMKKLKKDMRKKLKGAPRFLALTQEQLDAATTIKTEGGTHITIPERRKGDRRAKPKTRMNFGTEAHTQWFSASNTKPVYEGRYKVKYHGAARFVFRYWNKAEQKWQYNRRKAAIECVQPGIGDMWRGLAEKQGV